MSLTSHQKEAIDLAVRRELRWIHSLAVTLGVVNLGALVALFVVLPDMAAGKVFNQITNLSGQVSEIVDKAGSAKSKSAAATQSADDAIKVADEAKNEGQRAKRAAEEAKIAAQAIAETDIERLRDNVHAIDDTFKRHPDAILAARAIGALEWKPYTPDTSWGESVKASLWWRRVGDEVEVRVRVIPTVGSAALRNSALKNKPLNVALPIDIRPVVDDMPVSGTAFEDVGTAMFFVPAGSWTGRCLLFDREQGVPGAGVAERHWQLMPHLVYTEAKVYNEKSSVFTRLLAAKPEMFVNDANVVGGFSGANDCCFLLKAAFRVEPAAAPVNSPPPHGPPATGAVSP